MTNIMELILKNKLPDIENLTLELKKFITDEDKQKLLEILSNVKHNKLYNSKIHGLYHSEKVMLFTYIVAKQMNLDPISFQIIIDAALYHDNRRQNDFEDTTHGLASANEIHKIVDSIIYEDEENLNMLRSIVDIHSQNDNREKINFGNYELSTSLYDKYKILYSILKDADALDRLRFNEKAQATLKPEYLRLDFSKELIHLSKIINEVYLNIIYSNKKKHVVDESKRGSCFHGISFDFFKLKSILTYGILSAQEMKNQNLNIPRNFEGGNGNDWISVVDDKFIKFSYTGYENFIKHGISFYCEVPEMISPISRSHQTEAIQNGLPFDKSGHLDERYVYKKISVENILCVIIPKEYIDIEIRNLTYLYNSLDFELILNRINYYINNFSKNNISLFDGNLFSKEKFEQLLAKYEREIKKFIDSDKNEKDKIDVEINLTTILIDLNKYIQNAMYKYYLKIFNNDIITVSDVVRWELTQCNIEYNQFNSGDEEIFMFTTLNKDTEESKKKILALVIDEC